LRPGVKVQILSEWWFLFDPELNLWLQSLKTPLLTALMLIVSALGSGVFLTAAAGFLLFYRDLKKGLIALQLLLWSSLLSDFLKSALALPRPTDVHPSVSLLESEYPQWLLELFPLKMNFGFPSGHVWATTVFWCVAIMLFPGRLSKVAGAIFMSLMPLSRMYLGRHFLADVLGGLFFGLCTVLIGRFWLVPWMREYTESKTKFTPLQERKASGLALYLLLLPLLLLFLPHFEAGDAGKLFGVNLAFFILLTTGFPLEQSESGAGLVRLSIASILYICLKIPFRVIANDHSGGLMLDFVDDVLPGFLSMMGTLEIGKRLGLYVR
jgi:membrane-associated phospholipid phosphatase